MILLALLGCPAAEDKPADDTADTADSGDSGDTGDTDSGDTDDTDSGDTDDTGGPRDSLGDAPIVFLGGPSYSAGSSVLLPGDIGGDGAADVVIGAYYGNRVCWFDGPLAAGTYHLDSASGCLSGEGSYDFAAYTIASAGDIDGNGVADFLVGAVGNGEMGANAGKVYLVAGPARGGALADAVASWVGEASGDYAGIGLAYGGDLTGDGAPDLLIGASGSDAGGAGGGKAYLVPGPIAEGPQALADAPISFYGEATKSAMLFHGSLGGGDLVGDSMVGPGDVDGDGLDDLVLGAGGNSTVGPSSGLVAVFKGPIPEGAHSLYEADALVYGGVSGAYAGSPVAPGGDLTGDGVGDLLVAADGVAGGSVYLVPGHVALGTSQLVDAPVWFVGEADGDQAGAGLVAPGDLSGDGVPDLAIGAPASDRAGQDAGAVYVMWGPFAAGAHALVEADELLPGEYVADGAGRAIDGASDVTGDGAPDLLVGAIYNDDGGAFSGKAYLLPGR